MKAAVAEGIGEPLVVHSDWADPECESTDAIIRVEASGICRSDFYVWQGGWPWVGIEPPTPIVLGHEYCGVVEEVGAEVEGFKKGDRVVATFHHSCGVCEQCQAGHTNVCLDVHFPMFHYTGGYAEYAKVSRADVNLVHLPESISFVDAAGMGCRFMTAWHGVVDQAKVSAGEWVAVFGCGGVGLAAVDVASAMGANVIAVSRTEGKRAMAEALGDAATALPAIHSLRMRGRHLRLGTSSKDQGGVIPIPVDQIVFKELQLIGSVGMQATRYPPMLRMVESDTLQPAKLVNRTIPIEEAGAVLAGMAHFDSVGTQVINQW